jgi:hypothetical protein
MIRGIFSLIRITVCPSYWISSSGFYEFVCFLIARTCVTRPLYVLTKLVIYGTYMVSHLDHNNIHTYIQHGPPVRTCVRSITHESPPVTYGIFNGNVVRASIHRSIRSIKWDSCKVTRYDTTDPDDDPMAAGAVCSG